MLEYSKEQIEAALFEHGFTVLQQEGGFTIYTTNFLPGDDITIDWSRGRYTWEDLEPQLRFHGIDTIPIYQALTHK